MRFNETQHSWARMMWNALTDRGYWGVPRSGLVFQKRGEVLALTDRMPHVEDMPASPRQIRTLQDDDFDGIRQLFGDIGVEVVDLSEMDSPT